MGKLLDGLNIMNKKIRNATTREYDGIKFKSLLEIAVYKKFKELGYNIKYEPTTFTLWKGFAPKVPFYNKNKKTGDLCLETKKIIDIKYTPDFIVALPNKTTLYIEAKGMENDVFYIKKKLFRHFLENVYETNHGDVNFIYAEVYNQKHINQLLELIKDANN